MVNVPTTNPSTVTIPRQPAVYPGPQQQPGPYDNPGTDLYDWYTVNDALKAAGMGAGDWQIAGTSHQPIASTNWVKNPAYDPIKNPDVDPEINRAGNDYVIGVANPTTGQLVKIHLSRSAPDPSGKYSYQVTGREDQGKIDKTNGGYTGIQRESFQDGHEELWGTNSSTGAFEKMPNQPQGLGARPPGWNDIKQIDDGQGHLIWVGTDPTGKPLQPVPGAPPPINTAKYVPGSVKQVTKTVNGVQKQVYVGQNAQTQVFEDIPELGAENVPVKTTTVAGTVYIDNPKRGQPGEPDFVRASGVAQANEGDKQWIDAGGGYVKRQVYKNGAWGDVGPDDPEGIQRPVSPATIASDAATARATGALKPKGTKYWTPVPGSPDTMIEVTADGNGSFTYEPGPNGEPPRTMKVPGIAQPTSAGAAGATDEFLPQRRDPTTGALLPPEKNINWSPTNVGDRVRQLQDQARTKQQDLHSQVVAGSLSEDDANKQFNDWWSTSVEPAKQEIQLAQSQKQEDQARTNLGTAQTAANAVTTATSSALSGLKPVGSGFGDFWAKMSQGYGTQMPNNMTADDFNKAFVVSNPQPPVDYAKLYENVTAQALQHISPTAAQITTGQPIPTGQLATAAGPDLTAALSQNRYVPSAFGTALPPLQPSTSRWRTTAANPQRPDRVPGSAPADT